jgi:parvulin-like peptidyl-prolyl isomerase
MTKMHSRGLCWVALALLVGCGVEPDPDSAPAVEANPSSAGSSAVVARWESGQLTRPDYERWLARHGLEPDEEYAARLAVLLSLADAAERRGAAGTPEVRLAVEKARQQILLPALDRALDAEVEIHDDEIEALRRDLPEAFVRPTRVRLTGLFKRMPTAASERDALMEQMNDWRNEVVAGRALGPLAEAESDSQNRFSQGSVGWADLEQLPAPVRDAVEGLAVGEITAVVEHAGGAAFYQVEEIRERSVPTAEEVAFKLRQNLFRQRRNEIGQALNARLVESITIDPAGDPVVRVGDYVLSSAMIEPLAKLRIPDREPEELTPPQRLRLLREWAFRVALTEEADRRGLHREPEAAAALRWVVPNSLAAAELRHRVDDRLVAPDEDELRALFASGSLRLREPEQLKVSVIQFTDEETPDAETLESALRVAREVQSGALDFEQAARRHSIHPSATRGGQLPWLTRAQLGSLDVRLLQPIRALAPGDDTGLIRSDSGLWLARLVDRQPTRPLSYEEAREQLVAIHRRQQIRRLEVDVQAEQRARIRLSGDVNGIDTR